MDSCVYVRRPSSNVIITEIWYLYMYFVKRPVSLRLCVAGCPVCHLMVIFMNTALVYDYLIKSPQLSWRLGTSIFHLLVPDLHVSLSPTGPVIRKIPSREFRPVYQDQTRAGILHTESLPEASYMLTRSAPLRNEVTVALTCTTCLPTKSSRMNPRAVSPLGLIDIASFM